MTFDDADQQKNAAFVDVRSSIVQVQAEKSVIWAQELRHHLFDGQPPKVVVQWVDLLVPVPREMRPNIRAKFKSRNARKEWMSERPMLAAS